MLTALRPLRVAVLSSHRCPGAGELLPDDRQRRRWEIVCAIATEEEFESRGRFDDAGVPVLSHPIRPFYRGRGRVLSDIATRRDYDAETAKWLAPFRPDLLLFSSYLYVATPALLESVAGGAINIHGSDLTRIGADDRPKYLGLRAVADAILAGEPETRATAHWVTEQVDCGPVILRSRPFPVPPLVGALLARGNRKAVKAYAHAHQEWMLAEAWGPLWQAVLGLVAAGRRAPGVAGGRRTSDIVGRRTSDVEGERVLRSAGRAAAIFRARETIVSGSASEGV